MASFGFSILASLAGRPGRSSESGPAEREFRLTASEFADKKNLRAPRNGSEGMSVNMMRRFLLVRHVLGAIIEGRTLAKLSAAAVAILIVVGVIMAAMLSPLAAVAVLLLAVICVYLIWTIEPAVRNLDALIQQLVRLEIGGHGLVIDYEKPNGRTFISGDVKVENAAGLPVRLRSYAFEKIGTDLPNAAPMTLQSPESPCDEIIPDGESRYIKLEKQEFFGGREELDEAACVPMKLILSVQLEIGDEKIKTPLSRTLQCYALVRTVARDQRLLP